MHDPRDMTKTQWELLWCAGQGKNHQDELNQFAQCGPVENAKAARDLLRTDGTITCDDPLDAVLDYIILVRAAIVGDVQDAERHAIDRLLGDAESLMRAYNSQANVAKMRLFAATRK